MVAFAGLLGITAIDIRLAADAGAGRQPTSTLTKRYGTGDNWGLDDDCGNSRLENEDCSKGCYYSVVCMVWYLYIVDGREFKVRISVTEASCCTIRVRFDDFESRDVLFG